MMAGQVSYRNSLTRNLTKKTAQYFSHRWNADFLRSKGRRRYAEKSKLLLAGWSWTQGLTKLTLQIAPNHNQQLHGKKNVSCKYHNDSTKLLCKTCAFRYRILQDQDSNKAKISVTSSAGLHSIWSWKMSTTCNKYVTVPLDCKRVRGLC